MPRKKKEEKNVQPEAEEKQPALKPGERRIDWGAMVEYYNKVGRPLTKEESDRFVING